MNAKIDPVRPATLTPADTLFVSDWRDFLFVNFSVPPEMLQPHVPFALDLHEGRAFVSLVSFDLNRIHVKSHELATRWLLRPVSDHAFLNVRTYVVHEGKPGICFLAEWIPNPLSLICGPLTYGLPYRLGRFEREKRDCDGVGHVVVRDPRRDETLALTYPTNRDNLRPCEPGSADEFLLERYTAYTFRGKVRRRFDVAHAPWQMRRADWVRYEPELVTRAFPWFRVATLHSAQVSPGVDDVQMGYPHQLDAAESAGDWSLHTRPMTPAA